VSNVTYNAITTDFWGNLDAVSGKDQWRMFGTGGDAKGQPTQINSISHGSPWLLIRKILVGPRSISARRPSHNNGWAGEGPAAPGASRNWTVTAPSVPRAWQR
jgi:hypothetical protein